MRVAWNKSHNGKVEHPRLYRIWKNMRNRCNNPNAVKYDRYGGRGISICNEWNDFACFRDWALKNGYGDNLSIDRIDNDGNYCPDNCRWADDFIQENNRSDSHFIEYNGVTKTMSEWSRELGIKQQTLEKRINVYKLSIEDALTKGDRRGKFRREKTC